MADCGIFMGSVILLQGGHHFEVFSAQAKDSINHWKVSGASGVNKEFDKTVKSFVYVLNGSPATTKMQLPKDTGRQSLCLLQRYLILQLYVPKGQDFSVDIGIQDLSSASKRYILLSTAVKENSITPLHTRLPLGFIKKDIWLNLVIDLPSLVGDSWKGQTFKSTESLCLSANCKLRRIFTMRAQPPDTTDDEELYGFRGTNDNVELEGIPKQCQLAPDVPQATQVITITKLNYYQGKGKALEQSGSGLQSSFDLDLNASGNRKSLNAESFHIAFGSKVPINQRKSSANRDGSTSSRPIIQKSSSAKGRLESAQDNGIVTNRGPLKSKKLLHRRQERKNSDPGSKLHDPDVAVDKASLRVSKTWTDGADGKEEVPFVKPHPPPEPSSSDRARRKPRIKSAGKDRSPHAISNTEEAHKFYMSANDRKHQRSYSFGNNYVNQEREPPTGAPQPVPLVIANDKEVEDILLIMRKATQLENSSGVDNKKENKITKENGRKKEEDNLVDVIQTLRGVNLDDRLTHPGEYQDSDDESEEQETNKVYTYFSTPKSVQSGSHPRSKGRGSLQENQQKKQKSRRRSSGGGGPMKNGVRGAEPDADFLHNCSSEEEMSIRSKVLRTKPSPRQSKHSHPNRASHGSKHSQMSLQPPRQHSPNSSQPRRSISRKSLREIPQDDVRLSYNKTYNAEKYQMQELSASYERAMLESLRKQAMEDGIEDSEDGGRPADIDRLHYGNDSMSDSSDDEDSTHIQRKQKVHNYQEEMKLDSARLNMELNQSNPRDWGKVFSPPIVLSRHMETLPTTNLELSPNYVPEFTPKYENDTNGIKQDGEGETDGEEELDLLFDPVLNCYFDPKSKKYYELV